MTKNTTPICNCSKFFKISKRHWDLIPVVLFLGFKRILRLLPQERVGLCLPVDNLSAPEVSIQGRPGIEFSL